MPATTTSTAAAYSASARPMPAISISIATGMAKPQQIRDHIACFLQETVKAYEIDGVCDRLGMPSVENAWTYNSKRVYVQNRLAGVPAADLTQIARRLTEEFDDPELEHLLGGDGFRGVDGALKNIIFAADGAKPRIGGRPHLERSCCMWASISTSTNDREAATSLRGDYYALWQARLRSSYSRLTASATPTRAQTFLP